MKTKGRARSAFNLFAFEFLIILFVLLEFFRTDLVELLGAVHPALFDLVFFGSAAAALLSYFSTRRKRARRQREERNLVLNGQREKLAGYLEGRRSNVPSGGGGDLRVARRAVSEKESSEDDELPDPTEERSSKVKVGLISALDAVIVFAFLISSEFWLEWLLWLLIPGFVAAALCYSSFRGRRDHRSREERDLVLNGQPEQLAAYLEDQRSDDPGETLLRVARRTLSEKDLSEVVRPLIRDLRDEHAEAIRSGSKLAALWVLLCYYKHAIATLLALVIRRLGSQAGSRKPQ